MLVKAAPGQREAITWTDDELFSNAFLGMTFIEIHTQNTYIFCCENASKYVISIMVTIKFW